MMIYTAYQSSLVGFITNPGVYNPISTQEQLDRSGYERFTFMKMLNSSQPEEIIWNFYESCNWDICFHGLKNRTDLAVLRQQYVYNRSQKYRTSQGASSIAKIDDFVRH